ncbi:HTTM domain-containing protein [Algoriphagus aestuariicola]|uniref:HTTM domain-containing protein n=1 Tax=Algoriphagus aestuariicola TaxID=1852016 RepID=A0ABS3BJL8_9BACT|nr:HTTM domain-containing protein [Algoriphagus aestuariicola]MBN7799497.1 HTTM domain-containing protein [Algoriphagus aestuariicola]
MNKILYHIDHLIFDEYRMDPKALGIYRIVFSILIIFVLGIPDFRYLGQYPDLIFQPPALSYAQLLDGLPPAYIFGIFSSLLVLFHFCVLFGLFTRFCSIGLTILYLILFTLKFSFGKIDHSWMVTLWIPLLLGIAGWGSEYSIDKALKKRKINLAGWPIFILASILVFGMFAAGMPKLTSDWLSLDTQAVRARFISDYFISERQELLAPLFLEIESVFIWELFDYVGVLFELAFLLLLFKKRFLSWYIVLALFFHIMNLLIMNINFSGNLPIYLLFLPYDYIFEKKINLKWTYPNWLMILIGSFGLYFILWFFYEIPLNIVGLAYILNIDSNITSLVIMVCIFIWYVYAIFRQLRTEWSKKIPTTVEIKSI